VSEIPVIELRDVTHSYGSGPSVLSRATLALSQGGFYVLQGPSGAGKTTLLRLMNRLEEPSSGEILYRGKPLNRYSPPELRRKVLYVHQTPAALDASVRDNLLLPFGFHANRGLKPPDDRRLEKMLEDFMLEGVALKDNALNLSVGQLQRVCFLRGLLLGPDALLLDEPVSALDAASAEVLESRLEEVNRDLGVTVVMISHKPFVPRHVQPVAVNVSGGEVREVPWNRPS